jgi:hypothetical protein
VSKSLVSNSSLEVKQIKIFEIPKNKSFRLSRLLGSRVLRFQVIKVKRSLGIKISGFGGFKVLKFQG